MDNVSMCRIRDGYFGGARRTEVEQYAADDRVLDGLLGLDLAGLFVQYCQYFRVLYENRFVIEWIGDGILANPTVENAQNGLKKVGRDKSKYLDLLLG